MPSDNWHLDRSVSLSHMISTVVLFMAVGAGWASMSERVAKLEENFNHVSSQIVSILERQAGRDARQDAEIMELRREMQTLARSINNKLDRLIEAGIR